MPTGTTQNRLAAALILAVLLSYPSASLATGAVVSATPPPNLPVVDAPAGARRLAGPPLRFPSGSHQSPDGWADIDCDVDAQGHTNQCVMAGFAGDRSFAESALDYVAASVYTPAMRGGAPVPELHHRFHMTYKLSD